MSDAMVVRCCDTLTYAHIFIERDVARDVASVFQTHYFIIGTTYQRDDVRDRQRDFFKTVTFPSRRSSHRPSHFTCGLTCCVARRVGCCVGVNSHAIVASVVASHVACLIALELALVCCAIKTFMIISNWKEKPFDLHGLHNNRSAL